MSFSHLAQRLALARKQQQFRKTTTSCGGNQCQLEVAGQSLVNFSANDYLGLATDPQVIAAGMQATATYGVGSGGSPLVTGHSSLHHDLQRQICDVTGQEQAMLFSSGFAANSGLIATLLNKGDLLLQDKLNHASLMEAGILSSATMKRFKHNDLSQLSNQLKQAPSFDNTLVVSEGVFSMDGDCGELHALSTQARAHNAWLMVDDAHGFGVNGAGRGTCAQTHITPDVLMATFGKAIGTSGAFVAANACTIDYLTNFCRHYIYSTALPLSIVGATIKSIELAQQAWRHDKLNERIDYFKQLAAQLGLNLMPSNSAIQPLVVGSSDMALLISEQLKQQGLWVSAIRPPTVPKGSARLRITLSANHQLADIKRLLLALVDCKERLGEGQ